MKKLSKTKAPRKLRKSERGIKTNVNNARYHGLDQAAVYQTQVIPEDIKATRGSMLRDLMSKFKNPFLTKG